MKKILHVTAIGRQLNCKRIEADRNASIYPVKYLTAIDATTEIEFTYQEEFDENYTPIFPRSPVKLPPCTNRGGIDLNPYKSTTCILPPPAKFLCIVDYLSITFALADYKPAIESRAGKVEQLLEELQAYLPNLKSVSLNKGLFGYKQSVSLVRGANGCGLIGFDGNNDGCYVSLSGQGCVGVDMGSLRRFYQSLPKCKITRIDLAYDDLEGKTTVKQYKKMAESGEFAIKGTAPCNRFFDDMGSDAGCTLYVGRKVNGKEACIYEKGKQLGDKSSSWVRVEARLTAVDRIVPFEAMTQPADYLAACYPPFKHLSSNHQYIDILRKAGEIALDHMVEYAAISYGKLVDYLLSIGKTDAQVIGMLKRPGIPNRLRIVEASYANLCPF